MDRIQVTVKYMSKRLYVGNLSWGTTSDSLKEAFSKAGNVISAEIVIDKMNQNRSRGFGFVEMEDDAVEAAIAMWNGQSLDGRALIVNEARPKTDMPPRRDFGSRGPRRERQDY